MNTTATIVTSQSFQERITERIRESIGELLTAEEAKELVYQVIERDLLAEKTVYRGYSNNPEVVPSQFSKMVKESVDPLVKEAIRQWVSDNEDSVKAQIQAALDDGILKACYRALSSEFQSPVNQLSANLSQVIHKIGGLH